MANKPDNASEVGKHLLMFCFHPFERCLRAGKWRIYANESGKGDIVKRGEPIGGVGMTGSVLEPQLHFDLR